MHDIPVVGPLWLNGLLCLLGFAYHAMVKWDEYCMTVAKVGFPRYLADNPSKVAVALSASALAFFGTWALGWMNPGMAIGCGYMATSIISQFAKRSQMVREVAERENDGAAQGDHSRP